MSQPSQSDDTNGMMLLIIMIFILFLIAAWFLKPYIIPAMMHMSQWKALISSYFIPDGSLKVMAEGIQAMPPEKILEISYEDAAVVSNYAGKYLAWLAAAIVIGFSIKHASTHPTAKYRRNMDYYALLEQKAKHFPAVRPIVGLDLLSESSINGPWASRRSAIDFCLHHKLIYAAIPGKEDSYCKEKRIIKGTSFRDVDIEMTKMIKLNREKAKVTFEAQLGLPIVENGAVCIHKWRKWPAHYQALCAVFLLRSFPRTKGDKDLSDELLVQFNNSFYHPNWRKSGKPKIALKDLNTSGVDAILSGYLDNPSKMSRNMKRFFLQSAYLNPLMARLLTKSRNGILTTADFIWLRPVDRTLWYTLNDVGRRTPSPEQSGVWAHIEAEDMLKMHCITPEVDEAVKGLEKDLVKYGWIVAENASFNEDKRVVRPRRSTGRP